MKSKRFSISIPLNFERLLLKTKSYTLGESTSNSILFVYLCLDALYRLGYLSYSEWLKCYEEYL